MTIFAAHSLAHKSPSASAATMKWFGLLLITWFGSGASATSARAQQTGNQHEVMRNLSHVLEGTWRFAIESKPSPEGRVGQPGTGLEVWRAEPGGTPFIEENQMRIDGQDFYDYAAIWWDDKAHQARGMWCDSGINDQGCTTFDVQSEGPQVVLIGEYEQKGKRFMWREVFARTSSTSLTQTLFIGEPGGLLKQVSTVNATIVNVAEAPGTKSQVTQ